MGEKGSVQGLWVIVTPINVLRQPEMVAFFFGLVKIKYYIYPELKYIYL